MTIDNQLQLKLFKAIFFSVLIVFLGVSGYYYLFGYSFIDALYMTIITITTIGFGEVHPFGEGEKIFTIGLILTSLVVFGYAVSSLSEYLISGQFLKVLKLKKVKKQIEQIKDHTIVCGYGRNGEQAVAKLKSYDEDFVVIEQDKELVDKMEIDAVLCIEGDATVDETLINAGILKAKNLITALPSDADNLFVVLTARQLNAECVIISRASEQSSYKKLKLAGADNVIMPDKLGGNHMASLVATPDIIEFVDRLTVTDECTTNLKEISVNDLPEEYLNKTILDLDLRKKTGCSVIGFKSPNNQYLINPDVNVRLIKDSHLIVLGRPEQIQKLEKIYE